MTEPPAFGDGHAPEAPELQLTQSQIVVLGGSPSRQHRLAGERLAGWRPGLLVLVGESQD